MTSIEGERYTASKIYNREGDELLTKFTEMVKKTKFIHRRIKLD